MKRAIFFLVLMVGLLFAGMLLAAEPIRLYAGKSGGGYDKAMSRMSAVLGNQSIPNVVVNTTGSQEIVSKICQSGGIGLSQADAVARAAMSGCMLDVIADYNRVGELVVYMYPPKGSKRFRDLEAGQVVATDLVGSGSDTSLRNIRQVGAEMRRPPEWSKINIENLEPLMAIAQAKQGKIHGLVLVRASMNDPTFKTFLDHGWKFGEMWVDGLDEAFKIGDASVYTEKKAGSTWLYTVPAFYVSKGVPETVKNLVLLEAYR